MNILKTIWLYFYYGISTIWLFTVYMTTRIMKAPLWDVEIDPFASWRLFDDQILRDTSIFTVTALLATGYYFLSWWWFLIALGIAILNFIVFIVWLWIKSRKEDSDIGTTIAVLKGKFKR
jgi:hypothetical protein